MKRKLLLLCPVLFLLITVGCRTTEYIYVDKEYEASDFEDAPIREEQAPPETLEDVMGYMVYLEKKVQSWESWFISQFEVLGIELPEYFENIKKIMESTDE